MRLRHAPRRITAVFDDERMIGCAGLISVMRLAERCGLAGLVADRLRVTDKLGANATAKIASIVGGMVTGADSIDDLDVLRHGAMGRVFTEMRAPSTLGSFLRCLRWGHVRQLETVHAAFLAELARHTPLLPDAATVAFLDIDSTQKRVFGLEEAAWLVEQGVTHVAMESTGCIGDRSSTRCARPMVWRSCWSTPAT